MRLAMSPVSLAVSLVVSLVSLVSLMLFLQQIAPIPAPFAP